MSDDLETRLRTGLAGDLASPGDPTALMGQVRRGVRRRRTRQGAAALLAAAAVVAVVLTTTLRGGTRALPIGPVTPPTPSVAPGVAGPPGSKVALTEAGGMVYTLTFASCDQCTVLSARSVASLLDGTGTWTTRHRFPVAVANLAFSSDGQDGYAWGSALFATHDAGATWSRVTGPAGGHASGNGINVYLSAHYVFETTNDGRLLRAPVGGGAWTRLPPVAVDLGDANALELVTVGEQLGIVVEHQDATTLYTSDDGVSFGDPLVMDCPSDEGISAGFSSAGDAFFYACVTAPKGGGSTPSDAGTVYRSLDHGRFTKLGSSHGRVEIFALAPDRVVTADFAHLGVMTPDDDTAAAIDLGAERTALGAVPLDDTGRHALLVSFSTGLTYTTSDGGRTWQPLP